MIFEFHLTELVPLCVSCFVGRLCSLLGCLFKNITTKIRQGFNKATKQLTEHIFILNDNISHTVNVRETFVRFVDTRKAFEKISHSILWQKFFHYGTEGKLLIIIKSMYSIVRSCVTSNVAVCVPSYTVYDLS